MVWTLIAIVLLGFGAGYETASAILQPKINELKVAIATANNEADMQLKVSKGKVDAANQEAKQFNDQLEVAHAQHIETINNLHDKLAAVSVPTNNCSKNGANRVSASASAANPTTATGHDQLPTDLIELVKSEAYRADKVAEYAAQCWTFVHNNCEIKP